MNNHLIYIPFRGVGVKNGDDEWFRERIQIFKDYTLKSLLNQTNKEFTLWCSFRPKDIDNELTKELWEHLQTTSLKTVFTFHGLMYHDDRNTEQNETLKQRLSDALAGLEELYGNSDNIIVTRIDSDDMFHKSVVEEIQSQEIKPGAFVYLRGLVYNTDTKDLAEWRPRTNPPFHTIVFPRDVFFDARKHLDYFGDWKSHEDTILCFPFQKLSDYKYCVTVHPRGHISTNWDHVFRGKAMDPALLKEFGL